MNYSRLIPVLAAVVALAGVFAPIMPAGADDTELYDVTAATNTSARPRVLILMDDSGSMGTVVQGQRPAYDPTKTDYMGGISSSQKNRVYWSTSSSVPDANSNNWFDASQNRCASSVTGLDNQGFFQSQGARRWQNSTSQTTCENICSLTGNPVSGFGVFICQLFGGTVTQQCQTTNVPGSWTSLSSSFHTPPHVDCKEDVINSDPGNGSIADGYPKDNVDDAQVYSAATPADSNVDWGTTSYTFYSANYIDYWNDASLLQDRTRMEIAQDVISNLVDANTGVDFALATFNDNTSGAGEDGGRIIRRLIPGMSSSDRTDMVNMINNDLFAQGWTPLCESYYEVYRYLAGKSVHFGDDRDSTAPGIDWPPRDLLAENNGTYIQPTSDCAFIYVILMTDGLPTYDTAANSAIETLTGKTCRDWPDDHGPGSTSKNCLPELAEYMATTDLDNDPTNKEQRGITYTIGFATDQLLLKETAALGGGEYNTATSADELAKAFQGAVLSILDTNSSFTSPAVAVDSFTRTQSRDEVFYAMFKPSERVDWRGNVKKFKVDQINGKPVIVDKTNARAFDASTGEFVDTASSFWSSGDGGTVDKGGVGQVMVDRGAAARTIYTNTGNGGALQTFELANLTPTAFNVGSDTALWGLFGVASQADFEAVVAWARGFEIDSSGVPTSNTQSWIMGDVLHSKPRVVNYGALGSFSQNDPDQRILVGTNAGFVHMFGNDNGQEDWAFFPKELSDILNKRRINQVSTDNVYGVDLTPVVYRQDVNRDGTLDASAGDKAWAYFGLRRGGRLLYALDISSPDSPSFMWRVHPVRVGYAELGQTWSEPVITRIPGYVDNSGVAKPVAIFGAGYDLNKDAGGVGTPDSMGRGIFVADAETGALVRSVTPASGSLENVQETGLEHSVPGEVAILDSNGDELTDRIYFGDTGGNVWRVDLGSRVPDASDPTETWFVTKLADLGDGTVAGDRRFMQKPDIVRITLNGTPVDALLLGSGDRTNPLAKDVDNFFYMLRDTQTTAYREDAPTTAECNPSDPNNLPLDKRCFLPITHNSLYDITDDPLNVGSQSQKDAAKQALAASAGWKLEMRGLGEKVSAESTTLFGTTIFDTFTPDNLVTNINVCEPTLGQSARYFVDIFDGGDFFDDENDTRDDARSSTLLPPGELSGGTSIYVPCPDCGVTILTPPGTPPSDPNEPGSGSCRDGFCDGFERFPAPYGNFWYSEEY